MLYFEQVCTRRRNEKKTRFFSFSSFVSSVSVFVLFSDKAPSARSCFGCPRLLCGLLYGESSVDSLWISPFHSGPTAPLLFLSLSFPLFFFYVLLLISFSLHRCTRSPHARCTLSSTSAGWNLMRRESSVHCRLSNPPTDATVPTATPPTSAPQSLHPNTDTVTPKPQTPTPSTPPTSTKTRFAGSGPAGVYTPRER